MYKSFRALASEMRQRHVGGEPPYALFLGAGASLAPGRSAPNRAVVEVLHMAGAGSPEEMSQAERIDAFYDFLDSLSGEARHKIVRQYLSRAAPPPGYKHLANLVAEGYFRTLVTTNFDTFLEESLYDAGLGPADLLVLDVTQDYFPSRRREPDVKVVKLHGDPYADEPLAVPESAALPPDLVGLLQRALSSDLLMVSYYPQDAVVHPFLLPADGELWYVNPAEPDDDHPLTPILGARPSNLISGANGEFTKFFGDLADRMLYRGVKRVTVEQQVSRVSGSVVGVEISQIRGDVHSVAAPEEIEEVSGAKGAGIRFEALLGDIEEDEDEAETGVRIESLHRQLGALERESEKLQKKAAMYGYGNAPLYIQNQIESVEEDIDFLRGEIGRLSEEGGEPWPR